MSVNDILVQGGKPFLFLDYISINKILQKKLKDIIKGINDGCKISNCELVGGETAEMPGTYTKGKFDIAGFCVGLVEKNKILKQKNIKKDDIIMNTFFRFTFKWIFTCKIHFKKKILILKEILN